MFILKKDFLYTLVGYLSVAAFLTACSSSTQVTGVCKSCKPYYVRGEWHTPQKHYDYDEIGLASWYGPGFHGKPKPHGEPYDQFEMTAAHKTLPIPTIAKVTNLETGKSIKVLIDDRGPFVYQGRIIDLSVAAAKELGMHGKGTAKVRVTALQEESDRFSRHLAQYRNAKCPKGRRWVQIFQQDLAQDSSDLTSSHHKSSNFSNVNSPQKLTYKKEENPVTVKKLVEQEIAPSRKIDRLFEASSPSPNPEIESKKTPLEDVKGNVNVKPLQMQKPILIDDFLNDIPEKKPQNKPLKTKKTMKKKEIILIHNQKK